MEREDFRSPVQTRCSTERQRCTLRTFHLVETEARGPQACPWPLCLQAAQGPSPPERPGPPPPGNGTVMSSRQLAMEQVTRPKRDRHSCTEAAKEEG